MNEQSNSAQLASNTLWNALERFSTMGIQLICTFALARFLTPADFGMVGMLVVFTLMGNTITESGFSQALIRERECSPKTMSTVFWANLALALIVYSTLFAAAPWIARWFNQPLLIDISRVTFLVIPIGAISLIHITQCTRELRFRTMFLISATSAVLSSAIALFWAWQTHSVWALVLQNVLAYAFRTIGYWITVRWIPTLTFSLSELRRLFAFSQNLLITGLIGNLFNNIYVLLIGHFYNNTQTGFFAQADRIRVVTSASSTQVVQSVSYPILSRINHHEETKLRSAYRSIILVTLMLVGTSMALLMTISEDLMQLLMGSEEWRISGHYLYIIGVAGILFPLHAVNQNILMVKGMGRSILWLEVTRRVLMLSLIAAALYLTDSIECLIWTYALYSFLLIFINLWICGRPIGYSLSSQLHDISPILWRIVTILFAAQLINHYLSPISTGQRMSITLILSAIIAFILMRKTIAFVQCKELLQRLKK